MVIKYSQAMQPIQVHLIPTLNENISNSGISLCASHTHTHTHTFTYITIYYI